MKEVSVNGDLDYRASHLGKGRDYDAFIANDPFSDYMNAVEQTLLRRLIPALFPDGLRASLDFACGTGRITQIVAEYAQRSYGVDVSPTMIAEAREKSPRTEFFVKDLTAGDLDLPPVSLVTAFRFFGNAEQPLRVAVLEALRRRLEPGGYLVINNHRNPWAVAEVLHRLTGGPSTMDLHHRKLTRLLAGAGFRVVRVHGVGGWLVRHALTRSPLLRSATGRWLESVSGIGLLAPLCPDMVVVAQRT